MKRITVNKWQRAFVFRDGEFQRMLGPGKYWLGWKDRATIVDITEDFKPVTSLQILLQERHFTDAVDVVDVKDGQIALRFEQGLLTAVMNTGRYVFWKNINDYRFVFADIASVHIQEQFDAALLQHPLLAPYVRTITIEGHEKGLLFIGGQYSGTLDSGTYYWWKNNIPVQVTRADMRQQVLEMTGQEILTKDKATLRITASGRYQIVDVEKAILKNREYDKQLYAAFQLALRQYVGNFSLDELLESKEDLSAVVLKQVQLVAAELGVNVAGFGIRDIILPGEMRDILNQVLMAEKKAQAQSIIRREETASTRSLLNTARLMEDNQMLWKLKEMEYVEKIAEKIGHLSVNGTGELLEQMKSLFVPGKT
ncbi:slipin family protein [Nostoc ellipsosporum NOK]|nr:slipin family protein [Nostoc ellipsosporum NOK]